MLTRRSFCKRLSGSFALTLLSGCTTTHGDGSPLARVLAREMPNWLRQFSIPGASIALIEEGEVSWAAAFGVRDVRSQKPVNRATIFEAASMSKPLFCYQVLKLVEDGLLDLDRPLDYYLPEPYAPEEPRTSNITARMVMTHTTGLPNWRKGRRSESPLYLIEPPGTKFTYSGEGFVYLQTVVERIVEQDLNDYLQANLLNPMGMAASSYEWREDYRENYAHGHDVESVPGEYRPWREVNTAASLQTTPLQYARYLMTMLGTLSSGRLLEPLTVDMMLTPDSEKQPGFRYGLGWGLCETLPGRTIVYHGGANGSGHRCLCAFDRSSGTGFVVMSNSRNGTRLRREVVDVVFPGAQVWQALG